MTDPTMNDDDMNTGGLSGDEPSHIEVAPAAGNDAMSEAPMSPAGAPAVAAGPRALPQHYKLLFGAFCVLIGSMAVWQRAQVFGVEVEGGAMISGNLLTILSGYCVLVGILNIMHGRLAGMLAAFLTAIAALYFGLPGLWNTYGNEAFLTHAEVDTYFQAAQNGDKSMVPLRIVEKGLPFPAAAIEGFKTKQDSWYFVLGQFAPGPIFTTLGGFLMLWVFAGAMFGGKKKNPSGAPPPTARRRRR